MNRPRPFKRRLWRIQSVHRGLHPHLNFTLIYRGSPSRDGLHPPTSSSVGALERSHAIDPDGSVRIATLRSSPALAGHVSGRGSRCKCNVPYRMTTAWWHRLRTCGENAIHATCAKSLLLLPSPARRNTFRAQAQCQFRPAPSHCVRWVRVEPRQSAPILGSPR